MTSISARRLKGWRPRLSLVLAVVLGSMLALPIGSIYVFRIYENQLIHQAGGELIAQSAVIATLFARAIADAAPDAPRGSAIAEGDLNEPYRPILPSLDLTSDGILRQRPEATQPGAPPLPSMLAIGATLGPLLSEVQRVTLAGFRLTDAQGVIIGGREETGLSLAHVEEVAAALQGHYKSALRLRVLRSGTPPLYSLSRGTQVRVFIAMPVAVGGRVAGVVYASRTPSNIVKHLYEQRIRLLLAGSLVLLVGGLIGFVLHRTISRPVKALIAQTNAIARGDREALNPMPVNGTVEFAHLSDSFLRMANELNRRSDYVSTFAAHVSHELKSPLTAIRGAAELMRDNEMSTAEREQFLNNIIEDSTRLGLLVQRLRDLARAEATPLGGTSRIDEVLPGLSAMAGGMALVAEGGERPLPMSRDALTILLTQLSENARLHGATRTTISARTEPDRVVVRVSDNGSGISQANRARIFDAFFTTRREAGGTGMGLAIAQALIAAHGGSLMLEETSPAGTTFRINLPAKPA